MLIRHFGDLGPRSGQKWPQKADFEHFGALVPEVAGSGLRRLTLSIFGPWPQMLPKVASECSLSAFSAPDVAKRGLRVLTLRFEHFKALAPDVAKSGLRRPTLSILGAWPQKLPEVASES